MDPVKKTQNLILPNTFSTSIDSKAPSVDESTSSVFSRNQHLLSQPNPACDITVIIGFNDDNSQSNSTYMTPTIASPSRNRFLNDPRGYISPPSCSNPATPAIDASEKDSEPSRFLLNPQKTLENATSSTSKETNSVLTETPIDSYARNRDLQMPHGKR